MRHGPQEQCGLMIDPLPLDKIKGADRYRNTEKAEILRHWRFCIAVPYSLDLRSSQILFIQVLWESYPINESVAFKCGAINFASMTDSLFDLLKSYLPASDNSRATSQTSEDSRYLSRILSLRLQDLSSTEPESLQQANHSNNVSLQALSSRSHRTTTISSDHLATLSGSIPELNASATNLRNVVPELDKSAVTFASSYSKSRQGNPALDARKQSMLLARQADKLQDILDLPGLLSTAIASASTSAAGGANYSQALDLFAHIRRLQILFPDSEVVRSIQGQAQTAMKDMTRNLIIALRGQNIRLAAAIRTIGWLRRVLPELRPTEPQPTASRANLSFTAPVQQGEDDFGAIFLCARMCTFLTITEALAPLRDLADQETDRRLQQVDIKHEASRKNSHGGYAAQGQQTERYLKRYVEIFREQSFSAISMFRNIFTAEDGEQTKGNETLQLPSALSTFPLQLVEILMETLKAYLPNVVDPTARESLLIQVLYAANSLGRLGADFSMMIATLGSHQKKQKESTDEDGVETTTEPEWVSVIKKHRIQSARLEALAAGQDQAVAGMRKASGDIAVR
jgi:conserved oligomeric Golgi complex subunit 8